MTNDDFRKIGTGDLSKENPVDISVAKNPEPNAVPIPEAKDAEPEPVLHRVANKAISKKKKKSKKEREKLAEAVRQNSSISRSER